MRTLAATIALVLLGACGQTGPLYLPGEAPAATPSAQPRVDTGADAAAAPSAAADGRVEQVEPGSE